LKLVVWKWWAETKVGTSHYVFLKIPTCIGCPNLDKYFKEHSAMAMGKFACLTGFGNSAIICIPQVLNFFEFFW